MHKLYHKMAIGVRKTKKGCVEIGLEECIQEFAKWDKTGHKNRIPCEKTKLSNCMV